MKRFRYRPGGRSDDSPSVTERALSTDERCTSKDDMPEVAEGVRAVSPRDDLEAGVNDPTRRTILRQGGRALVYTAPLIQLFHPTKAMAASLSPTS